MRNRKPVRAGRLSCRVNASARACQSACSSQTSLTKLQVVSAMYAYLMTSWEELPHENKRALGFDFVEGSEGEEVALTHLARLFMDYADLSFRRALVARRRRLGLDE
jgi:hypothetical protein